MAKNIKWYQGLIDELKEEFSPVIDLFEEIDKMVRPEWNLPEEFTSVIKDVMAIVDTSPSDAINSGAIALAGSNPIFSVSPFMANIAEYDRAQGLEDNIAYHFNRANHRGGGTLMYDIAESSLKYNTICVRVDDLAHIFPKDSRKWTPLQKRAWSAGRYLPQAFNPKTVYYLETPYGISTVAQEQSYKAVEFLNYWQLYENNKTDEGKRIRAELERLRGDLDTVTRRGEAGGYPLKNVRVTSTYCIDDDKLMTWASLTDIEGNEFPNIDQYTFVDQDNKIGFINWSIRVAGSRLEEEKEYRVNPLLAPLYWSRSWDKLNLAKSIIFSEPIRRARNPRGVAITQSGEPPIIDYENGNEINLRTGEDYKPFQALTMDENALNVVNALESAMNRTTGASMIGDTTKISSNTPFSTFSAMVKVALSRLDKQRDIMAQSCTDVACMFLWWVHETEIPLSSYAQANKAYKSGTMVQMGQKVETTPEDFDLDALGIESRVVPLTPTDKMEQLNMAIMLSTKLNVPASMALEEMGYKNVGLMYDLWAREFLKNADVQAQAAQMMSKAQTSGQLEAQQEAQQAQQQAQQEQQGGGGAGGGPEGSGGEMGAGGGVSEAAFGAMGGSEGTNPAVGGMSATQGAPSMTREAITGQSMMEQQ